MIILRNNNGNVEAAEVDFSKKVDIEAIVPHIQMSSKVPFTHDGRQFYYSLFARKDTLVYTINCKLLKWSLPAAMSGETIYVNAENNNVDVYMKDITIVSEVQMGSLGHKAYITDKNQKIPYITNIFGDGKICCDFRNASKAPFHPAQIIMQLESPEGNDDLHTGNKMPVKIEGKYVTVKHDTQGACPHSIKPFITEYTS